MLCIYTGRLRGWYAKDDDASFHWRRKMQPIWDWLAYGMSGNSVDNINSTLIVVQNINAVTESAI